MGKFVPTSKNKPCPICDDSKGKCRSKSDNEKLFILCWSVGNASKCQVVNGFKCINPNGSKDWASTWVEDTQDSEYCPEKAAKFRKQQQKEEKRHKQFLKSGLLRRDRSSNIKLLSEYCGLSKQHRQSLQARGLTNEAIKKGQFFSLQPGQFAPKGINPKTPGVSFGGKVAVGQSSLACPAFDHQGHCIGYQLRLDEATDNKYRWAKGSYPSHLTNCELPITVVRPISSKPSGIGLAEGILKPFIAAQIHNKIFIGASSANFAGSPEQLKLYLDAISLELNTKIIDFYPDAGAVSNTHVVRSYRKTFDLIESLGYDIRVAWWGQAKKLDKDCDEIASTLPLEYLSLGEFEDICIQHGSFIPPTAESPDELTEEELEEQRKEEFYRKVVAAQRPLSTLSYKPNILCDDKERYLPDLIGKVPDSGILLIRAPKGSGKSHQIKEIKDYQCGKSEQVDEVKTEKGLFEVKEFAKGLGKKFFSASPRIALGREQAERWDYVWIDDVSASTKIVEGEEYYQINEEVQEVGACFDSFWKFANRDFSNHLFILDECELGLEHMVSSTTLKRNRPLILKLFEAKVKECLENNGLVILSDADLTDVSVDYIRSICPNAPVFLVDYQGCPNPWEIDFYTGYQDDVEELILDWFDEEINPDTFQDPIFIATDSQAEAEALEKQLLKRYPELLSGQTGGIIRIDSTVTQTDFGRNFVKFPNKSIEDLKPLVLIATSSLGVGVSLDGSWFKHVFGLFFGTAAPSQARQQLARERQAVPRTVWARDTGNIEHGIMGSFFPEEINSNLFQHHESTSEVIQIAVEMARDTVENQCDKEILPALINILQGILDEKGIWKNKHLDLRCKFQARRNFAMSQYALQLRQELIEEGHSITDCGCPEKNSSGEDVREQKEEDKIAEAAAIASATDIDLELAKQKMMKPTRSEEESHQIQKAFLKDELPGIELTPEFVHKAVTGDRGRWKAGVKLFWHCQRLDATKTRDLSEWRYKLKLFESGLPFLPDIKTRSLQCKAIVESGMLNFILGEGSQKEYASESPEVRGLWEWAESNKSLLKKSFGMSVGKNGNGISLLSRLLSKVGVSLKETRSTKLPNGNKLRFYQVDTAPLADPDRHAILASLDLRWKMQQEEKANREQAWIELQELSKQQAAKPVPATTQSQVEVDNSWCHSHHTYNILEENDTASKPCAESNAADFKTISNPVEELRVAFEFCESFGQFTAVAEGYSPEIIEDAIALSDSQPRRQQLSRWMRVCQDCQGLRTASNWAEIQLSQEHLNEAWEALEQTERDRLHSLYLQSASPSFSTIIEMPPELVEGVQVRINLTNVKPKAREVRADEEGMVGILEVAEPHRNCYKVRCEDGILRIYGLEYLEIVDDQKQAQTQSGQAIHVPAVPTAFVVGRQLRVSTSLETSPELKVGMQVQVNIQKASCPKVREVRSKEHGIVGTIQDCRASDLYAVFCEDGKTRYYGDECLEILSDGSIEVKSEISQVSERDQELSQEVPSWAESYEAGDEVWAYFPQSEAKWLKATVEWVRDRMVHVKSGFLGKLVEREDLIAPGAGKFSTT